MKVTSLASFEFVADPPEVFGLIVDPDAFPACFDGYGLIPAVRKIRLVEPLAVGVVRHIYNADNSVLTETVTILDRPHRHAYILRGFSVPFSWLVNQGEADWKLVKSDAGTRVDWTYQFTLTSMLVYPACFLLLKWFMQPAMRRCLGNMNAVCIANMKND